MLLYCCLLLSLIFVLPRVLACEFLCVRARVCVRICVNACVGTCVCVRVCVCVCVCVGRECLLECFDAKIVYAHKMSPPPPTSLFDMGRGPSSINLSFVRSTHLSSCWHCRHSVLNLCSQPWFHNFRQNDS